MTRLNLTGLAMLLLPIVMVKLMATLLGVGSPTGVSASPRADDDGPTTPMRAVGVQPAPTDEQRAALAYAQQLLSQPAVANPLLYGGRETPPSVSRPPLGHTHPLQMIMATAGGNIALIDGEQYRAGDRIRGTAWLILTIDNDMREVVLRNEEDDRRAVLRVD